MEAELLPTDVVAGILWRGPRYLAAQRPAGGAHAGLWEFPGGKREKGESPEVALARELREELGITMQTCRFWRVVEHVYAEPARRVRVHFFHVPDFAGEPRAQEGQGLRWVLPEEGGMLPFLAADLPLVQDLECACAAATAAGVVYFWQDSV